VPRAATAVAADSAPGAGVEEEGGEGPDALASDAPEMAACAMLVSGHGAAVAPGVCAHPSAGVYFTGGADGELRVWSVETRALRATWLLPAGAAGIACIAVAPTGDFVAVGSEAGPVFVLKLAVTGVKGREEASFEEYQQLSPQGKGGEQAGATCLAFSPELLGMEYLVIGGRRGMVECYQARAPPTLASVYYRCRRWHTSRAAGISQR
jgi:WD40 repeat protein